MKKNVLGTANESVRQKLSERTG